MDIINKSWLADYPPEIRLLVYDHFFSLMSMGIHATEPSKNRSSSDTLNCPLATSYSSPDNHWWIHRRQKALNLLLTCKAIAAEATPFFYKSCNFEIADCHCWGKGRLPAIAKRVIRHVVSPTLCQDNSLARLGKVFQTPGLDITRRPKKLTLVPVFFAGGSGDSKQAVRRGFHHLRDVLFVTRYELGDLRCWLVDQDRRLCCMVVDSKHNARVHAPYAPGCDTDTLLQELRVKCNVLKNIEFVREDRVKIVHEFMIVSNQYDCWLQTREFQNVQR